MSYLMPEGRRTSWCPKCEAPFDLHRINVIGDTHDVTFRVERDNTCVSIVGTSRLEAENVMVQVADEEAHKGLWERYEREFKSRQLLDVLATRR